MHPAHLYFEKVFFRNLSRCQFFVMRQLNITEKADLMTIDCSRIQFFAFVGIIFGQEHSDLFFASRWNSSDSAFGISDLFLVKIALESADEAMHAVAANEIGGKHNPKQHECAGDHSHFAAT